MGDRYVLATLGYQLRDIDEYLEVLESEGVDILVDVRENAWSHKPGFSKSSLQERLNRAGIEYVHAEFAGNPKRLRDSAESHDECLEKYSQYLSEQPQIIEKLNTLLLDVLQASRKACLMCYERHPEDCHRSILLEAWRSQKNDPVVIEHLHPTGAPRLATK